MRIRIAVLQFSDITGYTVLGLDLLVFQIFETFPAHTAQDKHAYRNSDQDENHAGSDCFGYARLHSNGTALRQTFQQDQ